MFILNAVDTEPGQTPPQLTIWRYRRMGMAYDAMLARMCRCHTIIDVNAMLYFDSRANQWLSARPLPRRPLVQLLAYADYCDQLKSHGEVAVSVSTDEDEYSWTVVCTCPSRYSFDPQC